MSEGPQFPRLVDVAGQRLTDKWRQIPPEWKRRLALAAPVFLVGFALYVRALSSVSGAGAEQIPQTLWGQRLAVAQNTFERKCSLCHTLDRVKAKIRWTPSTWYDVVDDMARRSNGAIGENSAKLIKEYVAQTFASKSWATFRRTREFPATDLKNPQQVFEARCSQCHLLSIVENKRYSIDEWRGVVQRMRYKWRSFITRHEADVIELYLTEKYVFKRQGAEGGAAAPGAAPTKRGAAPGAPSPQTAAFLKKACAVCHPLDRIETAAKRPGRPPWKTTVERMVRNGANLKPAEVEEIAAYLESTYPSASGRAAPKPSPTPAAPGGASAGAPSSGGAGDAAAGRALFQQKCTTCHGPDKVEAASKKAHPPWKTIVERMKSNGAHITPDDMAKITAYLDATYPSR